MKMMDKDFIDQVQELYGMAMVPVFTAADADGKTWGMFVHKATHETWLIQYDDPAQPPNVCLSRSAGVVGGENAPGGFEAVRGLWEQADSVRRENAALKARWRSVKRDIEAALAYGEVGGDV